MTSGLTRSAGTDTVRSSGLSIADRRRERRSSTRTVTPSWAGTALSEAGEGSTVASLGGRLISSVTSLRKPSSASAE